MAGYDIDNADPQVAAAARHAAASAGVNTLSDRPTVNGRPLSDEEMANLRNYFSALADEDARRFEVGQSNVVATRQQTAQEHADAVKAAKQLLRQRQYEFDIQNGPNSINERKFTEDTRRNDRDFGESNRRFGVNTDVDLLKTGATMRGALDAFQGSAFARGASGIASPWLGSLAAGSAPGIAVNSATQGNPTPLTVGTLANEMSGQAGQPSAAPSTPTGVGSVARPAVAGASLDAYGRPLLSPEYQARLGQIDTIAQKGLANLPLGAIENLDEDEQKALWSGFDYLGRNSGAEKRSYLRSRPGQGSALSA